MKTILLTLFISLSSFQFCYSQVSTINLQYYLQIQESRMNHLTPVIKKGDQNYSSFRYLPQKYHEYQVIHVARTDASFDDVYFIDDNGTTQTHTMMQTKPVNLMIVPGQQRRDSFNPHGANSFDEALISGFSNIISRWIF